jgi:hypothetical protein
MSREGVDDSESVDGTVSQPLRWLSHEFAKTYDWPQRVRIVFEIFSFGGWSREASQQVLEMVQQEIAFVCWAANSAERTPLLCKQGFTELSCLSEIEGIKSAGQFTLLNEFRVDIPKTRQQDKDAFFLSFSRRFLHLLNGKYGGEFLLGYGNFDVSSVGQKRYAPEHREIRREHGPFLAVFRVLGNEDLVRIALNCQIDGNVAVIRVFYVSVMRSTVGVW